MVVDLPILRGTQGGRSLIEFLDFLQLPEVPPTEDVVAHLEHCMAENLPASDVVYAILSERLGAEDAGCIDRLEGEAFIRSEEPTSELQSLMRTSSAVFCLQQHTKHTQPQ